MFGDKQFCQCGSFKSINCSRIQCGLVSGGPAQSECCFRPRSTSGGGREGRLRALAPARLSMASGLGRRPLWVRPGPGRPWPTRAALNRPAAAAVAALPGVRAPLRQAVLPLVPCSLPVHTVSPTTECFKRGEVSYLKARKCFKEKCQFPIARRVGAVHCKMGNFLCFTESVYVGAGYQSVKLRCMKAMVV